MHTRGQKQKAKKIKKKKKKKNESHTLVYIETMRGTH